MSNYFGIILLFFIQIFFLNLGIKGNLLKKDIKKCNKQTSFMNKFFCFHIFKLKEKNIYKVIVILVYTVFIFSLIITTINIFINCNYIKIIFEVIMKTNCMLILFLILINYFYSKI